jgi:hypothetical protein
MWVHRRQKLICGEDWPGWSSQEVSRKKRRSFDVHTLGDTADQIELTFGVQVETS